MPSPVVFVFFFLDSWCHSISVFRVVVVGLLLVFTCFGINYFFVLGCSGQYIASVVCLLCHE